jgi:hypothetical protein
MAIWAALVVLSCIINIAVMWMSTRSWRSVHEINRRTMEQLQTRNVPAGLLVDDKLTGYLENDK